MNSFAPRLKWLMVVTLLMTAEFSIAQTNGTHDTGTVTFDVFDNGILGARANSTIGYIVADDPTGGALFEGQFLVAENIVTVSGDPYSNPIHEWSMTSPVSVLVPPFAVPYEKFDAGFTTSYDDSPATGDIGVEISQRSYSTSAAPDNDYIIIEATIRNQSGGDLTDIYAGVFADWDVGGQLGVDQNLADFDAGNQLLYVWDDSGNSNFYYGVAFLGVSSVSGYAFDLPGAGPTEPQLYTALTTTVPVPVTVGDRRTAIGSGPYDIVNGSSQIVEYAFIHGESLTDLQANATAAHAAVFVTIEPDQNGPPRTHSLSAVYPNPFNPTSQFTLEIAEQQSVRIAVYDAFGREVVTIFNGMLTKGSPHSFTIDGTGLPSGVYLVRTRGEQFTDELRVTLLK